MHKHGTSIESGFEKILIALFPFSLWPLIESIYNAIVSAASNDLKSSNFFMKIICNK